MAQIPLVEGGFATVSDGQEEYFLQFDWHRCGFCRHIFRVEENRTIYMAAEVMGDISIRVCGACNPCPVVPEHTK